jgi:hypothetical protein
MQLLVKGLELTSCLEERVHRCQLETSDVTHYSYFQMLSLLQIESHRLQASLAQLNSIVYMSKEELAGFKDSSVLKFDLITRQYNLIEVSDRRFILKYINRIKLITRWRNLEKRRRERMNDRKKNILQLIKG